jgi:hypothetical protein
MDHGAQYCAEPAITALYKHDYRTGGCGPAPLDAELVISEMSFVPTQAPTPRTTAC